MVNPKPVPEERKDQPGDLHGEDDDRRLDELSVLPLLQDSPSFFPSSLQPRPSLCQLLECLRLQTTRLC